MNYIISVILESCISENCISEDDLEIYSFGLECMFLKLLHYIYYLIIGIALDSLLSLFVSACILIPLRTKAGGYHANTRIGCYFFSCSMVIVLCVLNKIFLPVWSIIFCLFVADFVILLWAPVENENRILEQEEIVQFRRQVIVLLMLSNAIFCVLMWNEIEIYKYLASGIAMAAMLLLLGKGKEWPAGIRIGVKT